MIVDYYSIHEEPKKNLITIRLPQTANTVDNAIFPIVKRKEKLNRAEQILLLEIVKKLYEEDYDELH